MLQLNTNNHNAGVGNTATLQDLAKAFSLAPVASSVSREQEWLKQRLGKFTASEFHQIAGSGRVNFHHEYSIKGERGSWSVFEGELEIASNYKTKEQAQNFLQEYKANIANSCLTTGGISYVEKTVAGILADVDLNTYVSPAMQWGKDNEPLAAQAFADATGLKPYMTGDSQEFILSDCGYYGCTPDGLIGEDSGLEIKCPRYDTHLRYLMLKSVEEFKAECPDYWWQIQGCMFVTGRSEWWFASYHPDYKDDKHKLKTMLIKRDENDIAKLAQRLRLAIDLKNKILGELK